MRMLSQTHRMSTRERAQQHYRNPESPSRKRGIILWFLVVALASFGGPRPTESSNLASSEIGVVRDVGQRNKAQPAAPAGACTASWSKSKQTTSGKNRITLKVEFKQNYSGGYNVTTLDIGVSVQRKNWLGVWVGDTADSITLHGAFSGPRSPRLPNFAYGYQYSNPFTINYSSPIRHFVDYSPPSLDCYSMTSAEYNLGVTVGGTQLTTSVWW